MFRGSRVVATLDDGLYNMRVDAVVFYELNKHHPYVSQRTTEELKEPTWCDRHKMEHWAFELLAA